MKAISGSSCERIKVETAILRKQQMCFGIFSHGMLIGEVTSVNTTLL